MKTRALKFCLSALALSVCAFCVLGAGHYVMSGLGCNWLSLKQQDAPAENAAGWNVIYADNTGKLWVSAGGGAYVEVGATILVDGKVPWGNLPATYQQHVAWVPNDNTTLNLVCTELQALGDAVRATGLLGDNAP